jgi:hypothetical protein
MWMLETPGSSEARFALCAVDQGKGNLTGDVLVIAIWTCIAHGSGSSTVSVVICPVTSPVMVNLAASRCALVIAGTKDVLHSLGEMRVAVKDAVDLSYFASKQADHPLHRGGCTLVTSQLRT